MSYTYRFVGTTAARSPNNHWPVEAKAFALKTKRDGTTAAEALEIACKQFGLEVKPSYTYNASAHTHLARFRRELKRAIANPAHKHHQSALEACTALGVFNEENADK